MPHSFSALIFDLDGTLTDSLPGIVGCLRAALDGCGIPYRGSLEHFAGPPVEEWVCELLPGGSEADRKELVRQYRACYDREGWSKNSVFPGVRELLTTLHEKGFPLFVCTSKPQHFAVRILDHFGLSAFFIAVYGDKAEYLSHAKKDLLSRLLTEQALAPSAAWMIGDRIYDIEAARSHGVRSVAAGWGYGPPGELAQADRQAAAPDDVLQIVSAGQP